MSEQKDFFGDLAKLLAGIIVSKIPDLAEDAIEAIFHKHKEEICEKADPILRFPNPPEGCPRGYVRDANGNCVPDVG